MGLITQMERKHPEGSNLTILNTYYSYATKDENNKKICDDFIIIVYKDLDTGKKDYEIIYKPDYMFYVLNEDVPEPSYNMMFIEKEKVHPVFVPYSKLEKEIAKLYGEEAEYNENIRSGNFKANKEYLTKRAVFNADSNIEDHYRFRFNLNYKNDICKINKSFFDIEVDSKFSMSDFADPKDSPINCVSFLDEQSDSVNTFVLRDRRNPLISQFEEKVKSGIINQQFIHDFVVESVGGQKRADKFKLNNTTFNIHFYDYEIELIRDLFYTIHSYSPDFVEGWNSSAFDLEFIIQRIMRLGYDPTSIMCDQRWDLKIIKNAVDYHHQNELAERGDYTFISGLPVFMDQMIQYASRRKSKIGSFSSFKLDDIGELEAEVHKLDYSHITRSVTELPWLDFQTFVLYNIMDVVVQKCIESSTNDLEYIFSKCIVNNTTYKKGHRQTTYLVNRMQKDWYNMGYIIGNNINKNNTKPPKFLGALVHDPLKTGDYCKQKIDGRAIMIVDNLQDYDFKALYPSTIGEDNIASNTQIGRIVIPIQVYNHENSYKVEKEKYSRAGEFVENMVCDNMIEYCHRWFHLGSIEEVINDIDEYCVKHNSPKYSDLVGLGLYDISHLLQNQIEEPDKIKSPIMFTNNESYRKPIKFYGKKNSSITYENLIIKNKESNS